MTPPDALGVVAFGDSITCGAGEYYWGVPLQSWAMWMARGLGLGYSPYAVDGAVVSDVVGLQLPLWQRVGRFAQARYDVGCIYIGTNDVRRPDWDPERFAGELAAVHGVLAGRCERRLAVTLPLNLGRGQGLALDRGPGRGRGPGRVRGRGAARARARVLEANAAIESAALLSGALVVDLRDFRGRNLLMADEVHPTALGQIAIAERALAVLEADGLDVRAHPSTELISFGGERSWWGRLRGDVTYSYRHLKVSARALVRR